eukprot:scaffold784_cov173-Alexandrium_tamarense.AAC.2
MPTQNGNNNTDSDSNDTISSAPLDLHTIISTVGTIIFSFFPLGSLLNGHDSPFLVSTIFHDSIYQSLGQTESLFLSQCSHLRKINDEQLIRFVRNIVEISDAHHPEYTRLVERRRNHVWSLSRGCPCPLKVKHLDLSKCRFLRGEGVHYCLKHMPNVERISLSSLQRFDPENHLVGGGLWDHLDFTEKLEYLDVSECTKVGHDALNSITDVIRGHKILHLDLSGCSTQMDDSISGPIVGYCRNVECLSVAGSKKITSVGVGIIAYLCRNTLRCLNLSGCERVNLPLLMAHHSYKIMSMIRARLQNNNHQAIAPPNFVGDLDRGFVRSYLSSLCRALQAMYQEQSFLEMRHVSDGLMQDIKKFDERWTNPNGWTDTDSDVRLFGKLEKLDISLIGSRGMNLSGCVATIAWLNGGRLKEISLRGLESVGGADIEVLIKTCGQRLKTIDVVSAISSPPKEPNLFLSMSNITELNLSCCHRWISSMEGYTGVLNLSATSLSRLRILRLDYLDIKDATLFCLLKDNKHLLRLSVTGCPNVSSSVVGDSSEICTRLLDLDVRGIDMNMTLSDLREAFPSLLRLNNRCTPLGKKMMEQHVRMERWRVGGREKSVRSAKRKRDKKSTASNDTAPDATNNTTTQAATAACTTNNICSLSRTGFCNSKDTEQQMYRCKTCSIQFGRFVCITCAKECHDGHDVCRVGYGPGYCDCCLLSDCKCLESEDDIAIPEE